MRGVACVVLASAAACSSSDTPAIASPVVLRDAFSGLRFQQPLGIVQAPGDARIFIVEPQLLGPPGTTNSVFSGSLLEEAVSEPSAACVNAILAFHVGDVHVQVDVSCHVPVSPAPNPVPELITVFTIETCPRTNDLYVTSDSK